mgnify:CR=1 FL=1
MTFKQLIQLLPKVVRYNLKIIFAGKFFWFLLAAFGFFALFMFQNAWKREEINEGLIYSILMFRLCCLFSIRLYSAFRMMKIADYWRFSLESPTISIRFGACGY